MSKIDANEQLIWASRLLREGYTNGDLVEMTVRVEMAKVEALLELADQVGAVANHLALLEVMQIQG